MVPISMSCPLTKRTMDVYMVNNANRMNTAENIKDIFINSAVRTLAKMPSIQDRQNYHRSLYESLFAKAKRACIISCDNDEESPSSFIASMNLPVQTPSRDVFVSFFNNSKRNNQHSEIILDVDLCASSLSATKLKTYLTCKRSFYYKYIRGFSVAQDGLNIGVEIHKHLEMLFKNPPAMPLQKAFDLQIEQEADIRMRFELMLWSKKLEPFFKWQQRRFDAGYEIYALEQSRECAYKGFSLQGKIDRIDKFQDAYEIIDYKSGKVKAQSEKTIAQTTDFQLVFYYLLCKDELKISSLANLALASATPYEEEFLEQKLELLDAHLKEFGQKTQNFTKTDDEKNCRYCPYVYLCAKN